MSDVIYFSDVRISFPNLAEPQIKVNEQTGEKRISYNCELLMPEQHPGYQQFMQRFAALAQVAGKEHAGAMMQMIHSDRKSRCYGQGAEKVNKKTFQPYEGYAGNAYLTVGNKNRPQMIDANGVPVNSDDTMAYQSMARKIYGGCRVNVAVKPWWQNANPQKQIGHGIRCDLIAVQFFKDDKPFGDAPVDVTGMFGATGQGGFAPAPSFMSPQAPQMPAPPFIGAPAAPAMFVPPWQK